MKARGMATLVGGALALSAYTAWPTWERFQTPLVLADMLDAYRDYFDAVVDALVAPTGELHSRLPGARLHARLARSNADASVDRLAAEPRGTRRHRGSATRLLATSRRFTRAVMALEAGVHAGSVDAPPRSWPAEVTTFARDVQVTLAALASALRGQRAALESLPDLRAGQEALRVALGDTEARASDSQSEGEGSTALLVDQTETIANSVNTMVSLLV
jgi:uncharacterized membrane protein YccC